MQYTVKPGDTLWGIAQNVLGNGANWKQLGYTGDPRSLQAGTVLNIPDGGGSSGGSSGGASSGASSQAASSSTTSSNNPDASLPTDYGTYYDTAAAKIQPQIDQQSATLQSSADSLLQAAKDKAKAYTDTIPTVQNIYSDLAKQLLTQFKTDTSNAQEQKTKAIGSESAAAAASGFDTTSGYEASMLRGIAADQDKNIQQISDKYNVSSDKLAQEESKDVSTLVQEAQDALESGQKDYADLTSKIVDLKLSEQQLIQSAAKDMLQAQTNSEKLQWQQTYQSAILDVRQQTLDLEAQRLLYEYPGGQKASASKSDVTAEVGKAAAQGATLKQLMSSNALQYLSPQEVYDLYNKNSKYGHAHETLQQAMNYVPKSQ